MSASIVDPITFSVLDSGLRSTVEEMKAVVYRTAYSNLWREAGDLSCGLLLPNGEIVVQGKGDIPIHLASMSLTLKGILKVIPLDEIDDGDVLIQNDPYQGNNHMPDYFMAMPVFVDGRLICFTAVRGHYVDIGGPIAGSYNMMATDIFGEGLRIPPVKICKRGHIDNEILSIMSHNMRNPKERIGDVRSQLAACSYASKMVKRFCADYSTEIVVETMRTMLDHSEATSRKALSLIPDGSYFFEDCCDGDGSSDDPLWIRCTLTVEGDDIEVNFEGSSPQCVGPMNSPLGVTYSAVCFAVKAVTEPHVPSNSGSYRAISIKAPYGSIVNPKEPAPVVAGNHETSARIADVVLGCFAKAVPDLVPAAGTGSSTVLIIGRDGAPNGSIMYEVHGAGQGGSSNHDGSDARRTSIGNTGNTPNEVLELSYPVRVLEYAIRCDGGGAGHYRGGSGIRRSLLVTDDVVITLAGDRDKSRPYGLAGGEPGELAEFKLIDPQGEQVTLSSKTSSLKAGAGSVVSVSCAGGGGYGPASLRDIASIQKDIDDGYVSVERAKECYGVLVEKDETRSEGSWLVVGKED